MSDRLWRGPGAGAAGPRPVRPDGTLAGAPIPFVEHYASDVTALAEIDGSPYVTWESFSPAFFVPVWFGTLGRDPGDLLFSVPWAGALLVSVPP